MSSHSQLAALFNPRSLAVVGASANPTKFGAVPLTLLQQFGYPGPIYPVNALRAQIQGLRCHAALDSIDSDIDMVIFAVPAAQVCEALAQARPGQISSAVVFSSGFAETGENGIRAQSQLAELAHERGIRLLGPNCLGFMNVRKNIYATFSPAPLNGAVAAGAIGMVTQSGAFGAYAYSMARERGLGLSYWISTGNELDVDVADCIAWLVDDPDTRVIMVYMEGCRDGAKLKRALAGARLAGKPIVITKVGRTVSGASAAASHTAALAGDDAIYDALFRQYSAIRAHTIDEFFNIGYALSVWRRPPASKNLGIMTISGGVGALMADEAEINGLALPALSVAAQSRLLERIPFAGVRNPVDITGQAISNPGLLADTAREMLSGGSYGALAVFLAAAGSSESLWPHFLGFARTLQENHPETPLALCALIPPERRRSLEQLGCLVFSDPSAAVRTIAAISDLSRSPLAAAPEPPPVSDEPMSPPGALNEADALAILRNAGMPVVRSTVTHSVEQAISVAAAIDSATVLKIASPDILHKSDIGGVKLSVQGSAAVRKAYAEILDAARRHAPDARIDGVLVAPMIPDGTECILGVHRDPIFGPVVMFGLGGIFAEILKDVSFRLAPFDRAEALDMIRETRASALLEGARGRPAADIDTAADALAALSRLAYSRQHSIASIDVNPFLVLPAGQGALALDAVVIRG